MGETTKETKGRENMKNARLVSDVCERLAQVVGAHAGRGELPVTVGGDHSLVSIHSFFGFIIPSALI